MQPSSRSTTDVTDREAAVPGRARENHEDVEVKMTKRELLVSEREQAARPSPGRDHEIEQIRVAVHGIRFGEVRVVIQDGVIVQIDRLEKQRLR
jgi:hypothetical protein